MSMGREATQVPLRQDEVCGCTGEGLRLHTSPKALVMSGTQGPMSRHQRVWAVTPGRRHTTEGPPLRDPIRFVLCGASSVCLVIVDASMSTRAHFVPVLQAPGFSVP